MRESALNELQSSIEACSICRDRPLKQPLPHEPRPVVRLSDTARICIAGQAPGLRVHESGVPFLDRSGDRLREWMGVDHDTFYDTDRIAIVPMGFCFPGYDKNKSDLPPRRECVQNWHDQIFELMQQIELVLVIGGYAQTYHMPMHKKPSVTDTVAGWKSTLEIGRLSNSRPYAVFPMPHPSWRNTGWLKKNPWFEEQALPTLRKRIQALL